MFYLLTVFDCTCCAFSTFADPKSISDISTFPFPSDASVWVRFDGRLEKSFSGS